MPIIDPGMVASSPFLADEFTITRVTQAVSELGRMQQAGYTNLCGFGIVTSASDKDLERLPEYDQIEAAIKVVTNHELRVVTPGAKADVITWAGTSYMVKSVKPYPRFGRGWYVAIAVSQNAVDIMPEDACDGQ